MMRIKKNLILISTITLSSYLFSAKDEHQHEEEHQHAANEDEHQHAANEDEHQHAANENEHQHAANENEHQHEEEPSIRINQGDFKELGIKTEFIKKKKIIYSLNISGHIIKDPYQTVQISTPYAGTIHKIYGSLGDYVKSNQKLATVVSSDTLSKFDIKSPFDGVITKKNVVVGQYIHSLNNILEISDLKKVWVDFKIPHHYLHNMKNKKISLTIYHPSKDLKKNAIIQNFDPVISKDSQSIIAKVILENPDYLWSPGLFVSASLTYTSDQEYITIKNSAIQNIKGNNIIFIKDDGGKYIKHPVKTGTSNSIETSVSNEIKDGIEYITEQSFLFKADFLKSEASHSHSH